MSSAAALLQRLAAKGERSGRLELPAGYRAASKNGLKIVFREGYAECFDGFVLPDVSVAPPVSSVADGGGGPQGRGSLIAMPLAGKPGERALVRRCLRGGVPGRIFGDIYLGRNGIRPLEELKVSEHARSRGVPTPEILAIAFERVGPFFYRGAVILREIRPSADLLAEFSTFGPELSTEEAERKRLLISMLGELVAGMHAAGILHADLHLKNVLASHEEDGGIKLYMLDLDAARVREPLSDFGRCANLLRLYRSVEKLNRKHTIISRSDVLRFIQAYAAKSSQPSGQLIARLKRLLPMWRLKWKLSDTLGI